MPGENLEMENQLRALMVKAWKLKIKPEEIIDEEHMLEKLGVNSVDVLEYLIMIEKEYDVEINDDDLNAELVGSLSSLADYIVKQKKK